MPIRTIDLAEQTSSLSKEEKTPSLTLVEKPIHLVHQATLHQAHTEDAAETYVQLFNRLNSPPAIGNVDTHYQLWHIGRHAIPVSINQTDYDNSYVCSPYTAYISYAKDELGLLNNPVLETTLALAIQFAGRLLKLAKINQTLSLNNWLVSTNLIPDFNPYELQKATQKFIQAYPMHSLSIRSLNVHHHPKQIQQLSDQGWLLIPARQVYLFDATEQLWWKRNHTKKDQSLLRKVEAGKTSLTWLKPEALQDHHFKDISRCFNLLFIEKHSQYNPQFSEAFLCALHHQKLVEFHSFMDADQQIIASIGLFTQQGIITTPIVGYDTSKPQDWGLYRLLMAVLLRLTHERNLPMNLSSGAAGFKRARGGEASLEYTAFYCQHLPWHRRLLHQLFSKLMNRYAPQMFDKHQV